MICSIVVGIFCLAQPSNIDITDAGLSSFATAQIGSSKAIIQIHSDNLVEFDKTRMEIACKSEACIYYHKQCDTNAEKLECSYTIFGQDFGPSLKLSAGSQEEMNTVVARISVLSDEHSLKNSLPLSMLTTESKESALPTCRHNASRGPKCPSGLEPLLGYPVFLSRDRGKCSYGIQDMIVLRKKRVRHWMNDLRDKERQIDLVFHEGKSERCIRSIRKVVHGAGFEKVRVISYRKWTEAAEKTGYSGLPPQ